MPNLRDLIILANSRSAEDRRVVLQQISDLFVERAHESTEREIELFGDVFLALLEQVERTDAVALSQRIAPSQHTPSALAVHLAGHEDIAVAEPVLTNSPVLTDEQICDVVRNAGREHVLAVTRRAELSPTVTDAIVAHDDQEILVSIGGNDGARFSDAGLTRLAVKATDFTPLSAVLAKRDDIDEERLGRLVASLDGAVRDRFRALFEADRARAVDIVDRTLDEVTDMRGREVDEVISMIDLVRDGSRHVDGCIDDLVSQDRFEDAAYLMAELDGLRVEHVENVLNAPNDFGIALVCRSLNVGDTTYRNLSVARARRLGLPPSAVAPMLATYRQVDGRSAERALRFHRIRSKLT